jgi:hypothetical protein
MPEEFTENVDDASSAPSSFELKFIECAHIITVPLRVHPDPHAPKPHPAAPARYDTRDFFSRPVRVPGVCPTCHRAKPATPPPAKKPAAKAAAASATAASALAPFASVAVAEVSVATVADETESTPPP